jgi:NitT/TauT family transport system ATP-binding protein
MSGSTMTCTNVTKVFGHETRTQVLDSINLSIQPSEIICIVGPSGCGKTTLLNIMAGFEQASAGACRADGQLVSAPSPDRGFVFQRATLYPWMNIWDNVTLGARVNGMARSDYSDRAGKLLDETGLTDFRGHFPYQISGGMAQRAQLVRVLVSKPKVMLMDEPFGALDYQTRLSMHKLLMDLHRQHKPTIMFITHDVDEAIFLADRVVVMSKRPGTIVTDLAIDIPRPRSIHMLGTAQFGSYKEQVLQLLGFD